MKSLVNIHGEYGTTNYVAGTAAGGEDHHHASTPIAVAVRHCRSLRLLCVDTGGWIRITYANNDPVDCAPLVKCNCECVAMWCKTGRWRGDGRGRLMAAASSNGGGDGRKQGGGGKERHNNQIEVTVAVGGNNSHRRS